MNSAAINGIRLSRERLNYITQNFNQIGLPWAAFGAALLIMKVPDLYPTWWTTRASFTALIAVLVVMVVYIPRYYRWRFGWVQPNPVSNRFSNWFEHLTGKQGVIYSLIFAAILLVFALFQELIDLALRIKSFQLVIWLVLLLIGFLCGPQNILRRRIPFFSVVGLAVAFLTFYPLFHLMSAQQFSLLNNLNACSFGISLILVGLYDHFMLVRMLPRKVAEAHSE
jgi:hypothetical protein